MVKAEVVSNLDILQLNSFKIKTVKVKSQVLKGNPWGDPTNRCHVMLVPSEEALKKEYPLVVVLAGFTGNSPNYMSPKSFESNFAQVLDSCVAKRKCPQAAFLLVDGFTFWGGSQFINSKGMGRYEDHLVQELLPAVFKQFSLDKYKVCVMGGSSGGYGALHLASRYPKVFQWAGAIAPDCFFDLSLLPEIYSALPIIERWGGLKEVYKLMSQGDLLRRRESHRVLNVVAMGFCYSSHPQRKREIEFPINIKTGELVPRVWKKWKAHDPLEFLSKRQKNLRQLKGVFLDVGTEDQFHLQWGARQLRKLLKLYRVSFKYSEFEGNHFDIGSRRAQVWAWLKKQWG